MNEPDERGKIPTPSATLHTGQPRAETGLAPVSTPAEGHSGLDRARQALQVALPLAMRLLPLLDGNVATAAMNLLGWRAPGPALQTNLEPLEQELAQLAQRLAELSDRQKQLANQSETHSTTLDQLRDQLLPQLEQQLGQMRLTIETAARDQEKTQAAFEKLQRRFNRLALAGILLLGATLVANLFWLLHLRPVLH